MLEHGGRLNQVARQYGIAVADFMDLSTGINPNGWPVPQDLPSDLWSRLPQDDDGLIAVARDYYQCDSLLAVAGSQAAIQMLPLLRSHSKVGVLSPAYAEHEHAWTKAGHEIVTVDADCISDQLSQFDVLILINPNNPTGQCFSPQQLLDWHQQLARTGGWLIVDEAFIDTDATQSLSQHCPRYGLIVLRSVGKFFGLAGLRTGFVFAENRILTALSEQLGPWPIASVSRYVTQLALADKAWQTDAKVQLKQQSQRLATLLTCSGLTPSGSSSLFQWIKSRDAESLHQQLAQQGIFTRLFLQPQSLRFGLPKSEQDWQRLNIVLQGLSVS
ncbi:MAG: threonine-phosphate decarboxylase [Piscirickettsiaceae bacterium]|nr:threonine-phosphate decarboxylase [Piscirickettsiaceae bacterium]